jgi:ABC-type uncharacterized transport system substrate-binding protein
MKANNTMQAWILVLVWLIGLPTLLSAQTKALEKRDYRIAIILDTVDTWSGGIRDGIKASLDPILKNAGARGVYSEYDTALDIGTAAKIVTELRASKPDLIFVAAYPNGFADIHITAKLNEPEFRFVSENAVATQIGLINSWEKPGGNVTGVGVFVQFSSQLRIARSINPQLNKLVFYSWDAMSTLNDWLEAEIKASVRQEGFELVAFHRVKNIEEHFRLFAEYDRKGPGYLAMIGVSPFVYADGRPADANTLEPEFIRTKIKNTFFLSYDESAIRQAGAVAGASVIWTDIGAQMAEKGLQILQGTKPGAIPWTYPRKYNLLFNLQAAKNIGLKIPENLLGAAYRIYSDSQGTFTGPRN